MKDFISEQDIENWCYSPKTCKFANTRRGVNERTYVWCLKYKGPAFSVLNFCKENKAIELREKEDIYQESLKQRNLTDFCGRVIS